MKKLTDNELEVLRDLQQEFNQVKLDLGNTVLQQNTLMKNVDELREKFANKEKELMDKYGKDVTINLETGEVTEKKPEPELTQVETE